MLLAIFPVAVFASTVLSFTVDNLESYSRQGNWVWDVDGPAFPTGDGNWFTYGVSPMYHFYADNLVSPGNTAGHLTSITCAVENTDLADNPS